MQEDEVSEWLRRGIAGWRGPSDSPASARYATAAGSGPASWLRFAAAPLVVVAVFALGLTAAAGVQWARGQLVPPPAGASATASPEAEPTPLTQPTAAASEEPTPPASPESSPPPQSKPTPPPAHEPTPPPEHEPSPPPES